jgi:hypothetical protein
LKEKNLKIAGIVDSMAQVQKTVERRPGVLAIRALSVSEAINSLQVVQVRAD